MEARLDIEGETYFSGTRVEEPHLSTTELAAYAGRFRSGELDATYDLSVEDGALMLRMGDNPPKKLNAIAPDEFEINDLGAIVFHRDERKRVRGLSLFAQSSRGIEFSKTN